MSGHTSNDTVLVAGIGNVLIGDDGFGSAVAAALAGRDLPPGVEVVDIGIRGVHLAYQLLDGYRALVLVDALRRGEAPGTLTVLETSLTAHGRDDESGPPVDPHGMGPDAVLRLLARIAGTLGAAVDRVLVVGCEPARLDDGIGLSPAVTAAVAPAADLVVDVVTDLVADLVKPEEAACTK